MDIENLRKDLNKMVGKEIFIDIREVKRPEIDSQLVAENIALQLERRVAYRRAMKRVVFCFTSWSNRYKGNGLRKVGGRNCTKWMVSWRSCPIKYFWADIDYGFAEALTTYGIIGIKFGYLKVKLLKKGKTRE